MPGRHCAVAVCKNNCVATKLENKNISYHRFPKGNNLATKTVRDEWIRRCKRADAFNPLTSIICSVHFTADDFERDLKNELLGLPLRKILKKTSVPTLLLTNVVKKKSQSSLQREARMKQKSEDKRRKALVESLITNTANESTPKSTANESFPTEIVHQWMEMEAKLKTEKSWEKKYEELVVEHNKLKSEKINATMEFRKSIKKLKLQVAYYKRKRNKPNKKNTQSDVISVLSSILTKNQINLLLNKKKRVNWTSAEISTAFTLRYYSKKAYLFLKEELKYPLPGLSSLRRWASIINLKHGVLDDVLRFMALAGESMSKTDKIVVLSFDEMKVKSVLEHEVGKKQVLGPHTYLQVVMARGLFSSWKQPVYINFDQQITKDIVIEITSRLHSIDYSVVACVSKSTDVELWNELNINTDNTSFKHPTTNEDVYMFADAPYLLKLLRNWFLDAGFELRDGTIINTEPLRHLINLPNIGCLKISDKHLNVNGSKRLNIEMATQLLSNETAKALLRYKPGPNKALAENVGVFIESISEWFDIFNSYVKEGEVPSKNAFGVDLETQLEHLDTVCEIIENLKCIGEQDFKIFQEGIIISAKSLKNLFSTLKDSLDIDYICTFKLNLDCLSNFFYQIRRIGGLNEHPSPLHALHRIRTIILGKTPGILSSETNVEDTNCEPYISATLLEKAEICHEKTNMELDESLPLNDLEENCTETCFPTDCIGQGLTADISE